MKTIRIVKKVIEGRPTVQYYIQVYRSDNLWDKNKNENNCKIAYVNYLQTQLHKNYKNKKEGIEDILRKEEFMGINTAWEQELHHGKEIIRDHRRRRGILRKEQLELMNQYDEEIINSIIKI